MVSEINVVPYIDVMLVLLVIFMVTAPLLPPGAIELPSAGRSSAAPERYVEVMIEAGGDMRVRTMNAGDPSERVVKAGDLAGVVTSLQADPGTPVVISADKAVRYELVMDAMDRLRRIDVKRVALMVRPASP